MSVAQVADRYDVAVVGGGPAGLAAATLTARAGLATVLFDEQPSPGGQIYRAIAETPLTRRSLLGEDYWHGAALVDAFKTSGAQYVSGASVWSVGRDREIGVSVAGESRATTALRVILATGALERPFPIPGWTLPGVMTAGAAQILLKSAGAVPAGRTVLAGCGPLLWLLAWQYLNAGARLDAILDTTPSGNRLDALPHLPSFMLSPYFRKGLALLRAARGAFPVVRQVTELGAEGDGKVQRVAYRTRNGAHATIPVDTLLLHQGVVPGVNLAMSIGIEHRWDGVQLCWTPVLDRDGGSSIPGIAIAGDGAGIAGASAAEYRGRLAAIAAVAALRPGTAHPEERAARRDLAKSLRGRRFVDFLYRPAPAFRRPQGDTLVCRCEEVSARQVLDVVALGCPGPNQMKAFLRCGMGPCQGRMCGLTVTELIAQARALTPQQVGYFHLRPPIKPIRVDELASMPRNDAARKAAERY